MCSCVRSCKFQGQGYRAGVPVNFNLVSCTIHVRGNSLNDETNAEHSDSDGSAVSANPCETDKPSIHDNESAFDNLDSARKSDELACKLAYENGWRLCDDSLRTLEAQRTRAVAVLSVTIIAASAVASFFLSGSFTEDLGCLGIFGWIIFATGTGAVTVCTAIVAWPIKTTAALRPAKIIENTVDPQDPARSAAWVHKSLASDLNDAYSDLTITLTSRNRFYKWSILGALVALAGLGIVVLDVAI